MNPAGIDLGPLWTALGVCAVMYVYFSVTLTIIAQKTHTPNSWLAWIPPLNTVLMCQVARRPVWWLIFLFIPPLTFLVGIGLWWAIAEKRGKPGWTSLLLLVPVVGMLVPAYLAGGEASPQGERKCTKCGAVSSDPGNFCGDCGGLMADDSVPQAGCCLGALALVALVGVGGALVGGYLLTREMDYTPPDRQKPDMPKVVAGTLTEMPVDTVDDSPVRPTKILSKQFEPGKRPDLPDETLPDNFQKALPPQAKAITAADYSAGPDSPIVQVAAVEVPDAGNAADRMVSSVVSDTGGSRTPVRVNVPDGSIYRGDKVVDGGTVTYILVNPAQTICVIICAPTPDAVPIADRLVTTVGNDQGLTLYPDLDRTVGMLPASNPLGLDMVDMTTVSSWEIDRAMNDLRKEAGTDQDVVKLVQQIEIFLPVSLFFVQYTGPDGGNWEVLAGDFGSTTRAWNIFSSFRWSFGLAGQSVSLGDGSGLLFSDEPEAFLFFQRGPYIVGLKSPSRRQNDLATWGAGFQL